MNTPRNFAAHLIACGGGLIVAIELLRHWLIATPIEGVVVAIGFAVGFVGAYMADRKGALEGGSFLVDSTTRIIQVVRSGRRTTDSKVIVEPAVAPKPDTPPADGGVL